MMSEQATNKKSMNFQAEVKQMLHLVVHSLYSKREIFLRELISNASDAIDKLKFAGIENPQLLEADPHPSIRVSADEKAHTITISDDGIGMNRDEIIEHLGTIANSGTREFFAHLTGDQKKDVQLIGQFGVGFYSSFIVADKVTVISRKAGDPSESATKWESDGEGEFTVEDAVREHFGTDVILQLKKDDWDLANNWRIKDILVHYSDHIAAPILMQELSFDEEKKDKQEKKWEAINQGAALWIRPKKEITEQQYKDFYHHIAHDASDPLCWTHNKVEGRNEYIQLLYIPSVKPFDLWTTEDIRGVKLYVKRVFIMDDAKELLPRYLRFVRGVIDSEDLPLNVSREILQQSRDLMTIRDGTTKRVLSMLEDLAKNKEEDYKKFWSLFGDVLKEGMSDHASRERITKLLRFASTNSSGEKNVSLESYVSRMVKDQKDIYYFIGESEEQAAKSPLLEMFKKKGIEVLLLNGPIDQWMSQFFYEFDSKKLTDIAQEGLDLGALADKDEKSEKEKLQVEYLPLIEKFKKALGDQVEDVRITLRLTDSPSCLVNPQNQPNPAFFKMLKRAGQPVPEVKAILELNPNHPLVSRLREEGAFNDDWAKLLLEQAQVMEGAELKDPVGFIHRVNSMLVDFSPKATVN